MSSSFPSVTEEFKGRIDEILAPYLKEEAWAEKKAYVISVNGYEAQKKKSVCLIIKLSNNEENSKIFGKGFLLTLQSFEAAYISKESFTTFTAFDFTTGEISDVITSVKKEEITSEMIAAITPAIAPFYFASTISAEPFLARPSVEYLSKLLSKFITLQDFVEENEARFAIQKWLKKGEVDFDSIASRVQKVCLTTPTPIPKPTPSPEEGDKKEEKDDTKTIIDKAAELLDKWHRKHKKSTKNQPHRRGGSGKH